MRRGAAAGRWQWPGVPARARGLAFAWLALSLWGCEKEGLPSMRMPTDTGKATKGTSASGSSVSPADRAEASASGPRAAQVHAAVARSAVRKLNFTIDFAPYALEVDPVDGGRIVSFSLGGRNVILTREESPVAYGSSFWPSPQSDWAWPPPVALDKAEWAASVDGSTLVLESRVDDKMGISARQRITADVARGALDIEFTISNRGGAPRRVAPWQNTRVRPGGITFYPSAEATLPNSSLQLSPVDGVVWFAHSPEMRKSGKAFGNGGEGWLAQAAGDLVFVKMFPQVPREAQAPGEAEIEIYTHESGQFVEMEQQGPFVELGPGASSTWPVRWVVRQLPPGVTAEARGAKLVEFVRGLVASVR